MLWDKKSKLADKRLLWDIIVQKADAPHEYSYGEDYFQTGSKSISKEHSIYCRNQSKLTNHWINLLEIGLSHLLTKLPHFKNEKENADQVIWLIFLSWEDRAIQKLFIVIW